MENYEKFWKHFTAILEGNEHDNCLQQGMVTPHSLKRGRNPLILSVIAFWGRGVVFSRDDP
jgi:hypothetical protein